MEAMRAYDVMTEERTMPIIGLAPMLHRQILTDFIAGRSKKSLKDLRGEICFRDGYDYKLMRG